MNPYTHTVTDRTISFTAEFKRIFWERMQSGESPIIILQDMGYDPGVLGKERIHGIRTHIKEQVLSGEGIHEGRRTAGRGMTVNDLDQLPPSKSMIK